MGKSVRVLYNINLFISYEICKGIDFAHKRGVQHRDIKPNNVFVSKFGFVKIGDFGLARFINSATRTHTVWRAHTPAYSGPEQWKGKKPTIETDLYQLGCTLFHLFTQNLPFDCESLEALMHAHINNKPYYLIRSIN